MLCGLCVCCVVLLLVFCLICIFIVGSSVSVAQQKISLDEAIKQSINKNKQLQSAVYDVSKAEADVDEAFGYALPRVDLSANFTRYLLPMQFFFNAGALGAPQPGQPEMQEPHA